MEKNFLVETEELKANVNSSSNKIVSLQITNDMLVNKFLNKEISLESLIEKEILKW